MFPHEEGDGMTDEELRPYWYGDYIFRTYCVKNDDWNQWRDDALVCSLVPFFMRCKCMMEHLQHQYYRPASWLPNRARIRMETEVSEEWTRAFTEFQYAVDRATTISQLCIYWWMRGEEKEVCRKWWDAIVALNWKGGLRLSGMRCTPGYIMEVKNRIKMFQSIIRVAETIELDSAVF